MTAWTWSAQTWAHIEQWARAERDNRAASKDATQPDHRRRLKRSTADMHARHLRSFARVAEGGTFLKP